MEKKKYKYLTPLFLIIPGVRALFEKLRGKLDSKQNQICQYKEGHITPFINSKISCYLSHINKIYLRTTKEITPLVQEAYMLIVEYNKFFATVKSDYDPNSEEGMRQAAGSASRKKAIYTRLASIKAELEMVNQLLAHYEERAERLLTSRISRYWRGVLTVSSGKLAPFPYVEYPESQSKALYIKNKEKLMEMIDEILKDGGDDNAEEENESA